MNNKTKKMSQREEQEFAVVKKMKQDLGKRAKDLDVILKPISTALLRSMKYHPNNPMGCRDDYGERTHGRRAKPFQQRYYSQQWFVDFIARIVRRERVGPAGLRNIRMNVCGNTIGGYLQRIMCLDISDETRGVAAFRMTGGGETSDTYDLLGIAFYQPFKSSQKYKKVKEPTAAQRSNQEQHYLVTHRKEEYKGKSWWEALSKQPLEWKGIYPRINSTEEEYKNRPQTAAAVRGAEAAMKTETYAELELLCTKFANEKNISGVGTLLTYYALWDIWRRKKGNQQRFDGVVLATANEFTPESFVTRSGNKMSEEAVANKIKSKMAEPRGLGTFYSTQFGFKRVKAVHRGTDYHYWTYTEEAAPSYYMMLSGEEWESLPRKIAVLAARGPPQRQQQRAPKMSPEFKTERLCASGERGDVAPGSSLQEPDFTLEWKVRRNVRRTAKYTESKGGRGGECIYK